MQNQSLNLNSGKILIAFGVLALTLLLTALFIRLGWKVLLAVDAVILLAAVTIFEIRLQQTHATSTVLIPLLIFSLPIQAFLIRTIPVLLTAQFSTFVILFFCVSILPPQARREYFQRIKPVLLPVILFVLVITLSYLTAGNLVRNDWVFLLSLFGAGGYAFVSGIYCTSQKNVKRLMWVLIGIAVIQMPFVYAQSKGWTNRLPDILHEFASTTWGGTGEEVRVMRYGGMFGDYELLAEYLDIGLLLSVGLMIITESNRERILALAASAMILIAGFYTGTRAFILSFGGGLAVIVLLMIFKGHFKKRIKFVILTAGCLLLALSLLRSQPMYQGYIDRFLATEIRVGYYDTRTAVWNASFELMQEMPVTGYGALLPQLLSYVSNGNKSPHSLYFYMFLISGYPGVVAVTLLIVLPILWLLKIILDKRFSQSAPTAILFFGLWTMWMINEIKIEFTRYPFYMNIIFALFGMIASFSVLAQKETEEHQRQLKE